MEQETTTQKGGMKYLLLGLLLAALAGGLLAADYFFADVPVEVPQEQTTLADEWNASADLAAVAVPGTSVDLSNCVPSPEVVAVKQGADITFSNNGAEAVTVYINGSAIGLPGGEEIMFAIDANLPPATYGYECSLTEGVVGAVVVTE